MRFSVQTIVFLSVLLATSPVFAGNKIAAIVNDEAISERDMEQRLKLSRILTRRQNGKSANISKDDLLNALIDEKIKKQEIGRAGISTTKKETDEIVQQAIRQNGFSPVELKKILTKNGIPFSLVEDQITTDFLFIRAVSKTTGARTDISDAEIDARLKEIKTALTTKQYLLSEIVFPIRGDDAAAYGKAMEALIALREGTPFDVLAKKLSSGPTAAQGGIMGWVPENTISPAVKEELALMQVGEVSSPVKTPQGYKIIAFHNVQEPRSVKKQDAFELMQAFVPFSMPPEKRKEAFDRLRKTDGSCADFTTVAVEMNTTPRIELGVVTISEIPPEILKLLRRTGVLKTTAPMKIDSGELVFMACRQTIAEPLPSKEQIRARLENERLETVAERYLRQLRRNAIVEKRL